jgi:hypothetical protein
MLIALPSEYPNSAALLESQASMTACTSSIRCSSELSPGALSDSPVSRLSNMITRPSDAIRLQNAVEIWLSHHRSRWLISPGTATTSSSPSPNTW